MANLYDGSDTELTYGQAICLLAGRGVTGDAAKDALVLRALQKEHGLLPPEPANANVPDPDFQAAVKAEVERQLAAAKS